jgi:hypothetical protein
MPDSQLSADLRAIADAGYLLERVTERDCVTLRARHGTTTFAETAPNDEMAASRLLAKVRNAPRPGGPAAKAALAQDVLTHPERWPRMTPRDHTSSN